MKSVLIFLTGAVLAVCLTFTAVQADAKDYEDYKDYARSGAYIGAGGLLAFQDFSNTEGVNVDTMAPGFNLKAGYRFLPNFSAELDFSYLDHWDVGVGDVAEFSALTIFTKAKAYLATGDTQPYINAGFGMVKGKLSADAFGPQTSVDETSSAASFGGGIDFYAREDIVFYVEAAYYVIGGNLDDFSFIPVYAGIQYRY